MILPVNSFKRQNHVIIWRAAEKSVWQNTLSIPDKNSQTKNRSELPTIRRQWVGLLFSHRWKHAARVFRWLTVTWARGRTLRRGLVETLLLEVKGEEGKHEAGEGLAPSRGKPQVTRGWKGRKPSAASRRALWVRGWGSRLRQRPAFRVLCVATKADL